MQSETDVQAGQARPVSLVAFQDDDVVHGTRLANFFVRIMFGVQLNDTTNAFKAYRKSALDGCRPFLSPHFNLTVELPLKAIVRGYTWKVIPITWRNRRTGLPKLKIREMGSRYFFIVAYVWLEKYFSRGDYRRMISEKKIEEAE